jgi:hypothetical protein
VVPRPSRALRRAGSGMLVAMPPAYATRFRNEISGAMQAAWHEQHRVAAASLPALAKNARTGHPVFGTGGKTTRKADHSPLSKMGQPVEATDWLLNGHYGNHRSLILSAGPTLGACVMRLLARCERRCASGSPLAQPG